MKFFDRLFMNSKWIYPWISSISPDLCVNVSEFHLEVFQLISDLSRRSGWMRRLIDNLDRSKNRGKDRSLLGYAPMRVILEPLRIRDMVEPRGYCVRIAVKCQTKSVEYAFDICTLSIFWRTRIMSSSFDYRTENRQVLSRARFSQSNDDLMASHTSQISNKEFFLWLFLTSHRITARQVSLLIGPKIDDLD